MSKYKPTNGKAAPTPDDAPNVFRLPPHDPAGTRPPLPGEPGPVSDGDLPLANFDFLSTEEFGNTEKVAEKMAAFESIIVPTPHQMQAVAQMNTIRMMSLNQAAGETRRGVRYLHPSGAGKSTCAKIITQHLIKLYGRDPERKPVLHVTLSTTGTPKSLASSILKAVGCGYSRAGEADMLLDRVREAIREFKVELLIIDELNHIKGKSLATDAANTLKNLLTEGLVPIVLMGTSAAENVVKSNRELKMRCQPQVFLRPYEPEDPLDLKHWSKLLGHIDDMMVAHEIVQIPTGLQSLAYKLCKASNGLIGEFHGIMLAALEAALSAGYDHVSYDCLSNAIDEWAISDGTIDSNPLAENGSDNGTAEDDTSGGEGLNDEDGE
ncbi:ATP-binding protein [Novosphingobium rosa]|uniref:ATP-binding protein n=1 Tax=Novosphingobium rosa TaxID=76978 RepID=UPI000AC59FD4|nr:ATP-binding protein [Novosphingobium rosa]